MLESCPKCHRKTWSVKWKSCSGCGFREGDVTAQAALSTAAPKKKATKNAWRKAWTGSDVTENVTAPPWEESHADSDKNVTNGVTPGKVCPTCKRRVPMSAVQRKQAERGRRRA